MKKGADVKVQIGIYFKYVLNTAKTAPILFHSLKNVSQCQQVFQYSKQNYCTMISTYSLYHPEKLPSINHMKLHFK